MPFKKELYPENWSTEIRPAILKRAGNRCEHPGCGVENHSIIEGNKKGSKIVLTVHHRDKNTWNNDPDNLIALCQKHHLQYERELNMELVKYLSGVPCYNKAIEKVKKGKMVEINDQAVRDINCQKERDCPKKRTFLDMIFGRNK